MIGLEKLVFGGHTQKIDKVVLTNVQIVLEIKPVVSKSSVRESLNGFIRRYIWTTRPHRASVNYQVLCWLAVVHSQSRKYLWLCADLVATVWACCPAISIHVFSFLLVFGKINFAPAPNSLQEKVLDNFASNNRYKQSAVLALQTWWKMNGHSS